MDASSEAVPMVAIHHKSFSFEYGSDSEEDLEIDMQINKNDEFEPLIDEGEPRLVKRDCNDGRKGNIVWVTRYRSDLSYDQPTGPNMVPSLLPTTFPPCESSSTLVTSESTLLQSTLSSTLPSGFNTFSNPVFTQTIQPQGPNNSAKPVTAPTILPGSPTSFPPNLPSGTVNPYPLVTVEVTQTVLQAVTQTAYQTAYQTRYTTDFQTAYLTIPKYLTVTEPLITTVLEPVTETVTEALIGTVTQAIAQPVPTTMTVTVTASAADCLCIYQKGYKDGWNAKGQCGTNGNDFQLGFVNGARWAYQIGYSDCQCGKPLCVPSFYTTTQSLLNPTLLPGFAGNSPCNLPAGLVQAGQASGARQPVSNVPRGGLPAGQIPPVQTPYCLEPIPNPPCGCPSPVWSPNCKQPAYRRGYSFPCANPFFRHLFHRT